MIYQGLAQPPATDLHYARHWLLLGCFTVVLAVLNRLHLFDRPFASFAMYGALHALALVLALRSPKPLCRKCLFVAIAAFLSMVTLCVGIAGRPLIGSHPGSWGLYALLGLSSATGALTYGILIRLCWVRTLTWGWLATISSSCMLATFLAFFTLNQFPLLGRWWLAALWWYTLSGGLWLCEKRQGHLPLA